MLERQRILKAYPPNYSALSRRFPIKGKPGIIYSWGDIVYNPSGDPIPHQLIAHELVHGNRQCSNVKEWWERYIDDVSFRLEEEVPAHMTEWEAFRVREWRFDTQRRYREQTAQRLSSPLYGSMCTYEEALEWLNPYLPSPQTLAAPITSPLALAVSNGYSPFES